jgi:hypothetical protein
MEVFDTRNQEKKENTNNTIPSCRTIRGDFPVGLQKYAQTNHMSNINLYVNDPLLHKAQSPLSCKRHKIPRTP